MKQTKEKTEAEKTIERLKERPMPKEAQEAIKQKQEYVNKPICK